MGVQKSNPYNPHKTFSIVDILIPNKEPSLGHSQPARVDLWINK